MLNLGVKKKSQIILATLILSVFLIAMTALSTVQLVREGPGGTIDIADGISLRIEPHSLQEDVVITAELLWPAKKRDPIQFSFLPDNIIFGRSAKLIVDLATIEAMGLKQLTLYGPDDEPIQPKIKGSRAEYEIKHFSIYYYRRR